MQKENPFFFSFPSASNFGKAKVTEKNAPQKFGFVLSLYQLNISNHLSDANLLKIRQKNVLERKMLKKLRYWNF